MLGLTTRANRTYQQSRFPSDQYDLISKTAEYGSCENTLEIGCNQGMLVQRFSEDGKISFGVDLRPYWSGHDMGQAILGPYEVDISNAHKLPLFDIVCILSVHHQWVAANGDDYAGDLIKAILERSRFGIFIEFSARSKKYGYIPGQRFQDNDEISVKKYANDWLTKYVGVASAEYLGRSRELEGKEPYRYMFLILK